MTIALIFKVFATIWMLGWFGFLGVMLRNSRIDEIWPVLFGWAIAVICVHAALAVPVGLLCWIWL